MCMLTTILKMNTKAHTSGSSFPPREDENKLRIYGMRYCPYAQRALLTLHYKGIPHEVVNIHIYNKPEWIYDKNPLGKVPTLEFKDKIIYESMICLDYLDEVYPEPRLNPADPYEKAQQRMLLERYSQKVIPLFYKFLRNGEDEEKINELLDKMGKLEKEIVGPYFRGDRLQAIDFGVWPHLERLYMMQPAISTSDYIDRFPKLKRYCETMSGLEAVRAIAMDHLGFYKDLRAGNEYNPDFGL